MDLDSDGENELLFGFCDRYNGANGVLDVYTMVDGKVEHMACASDLTYNYLAICENGRIMQYNYYPLKGSRKGYTAYYTLENGTMQLTEAFISEPDGENIRWYYSTESLTSENAREISWEEARRMQNQEGYAKREILFTPFVEMPLTFDSYDFDYDGLTFADLSEKEFYFYGGTGVGDTTLCIHGDGTFDGYYYSNNAGVIYQCDFSGQFSDLTRSGPFEFAMKCESIKTKQKPGTEGTVDGKTVHYTEPYGFNNAEEFKLYAPGKAASELPAGFLSWSHGEAGSGHLECYGLYNVNGKQGFIDERYSDLRLGS